MVGEGGALGVRNFSSNQVMKERAASSLTPPFICNKLPFPRIATRRRRGWKIILVLLLENFKMLSPWKLLLSSHGACLWERVRQEEGSGGEDEDGVGMRCTKGSLYHLSSVTSFGIVDA